VQGKTLRYPIEIMSLCVDQGSDQDTVEVLASHEPSTLDTSATATAIGTFWDPLVSEVPAEDQSTEAC